VTPWYRVAVPREDLREGRPLDAAQFAVHLDQVVAGDAPAEYGDPERFLARTLLTEGLARITGEVLTRLSGRRDGANAVLNLVTAFGGGKTHALTLLYHLARLGPAADALPGVRALLEATGLPSVPQAAVAVFVGTRWDAVTGTGGDGEPARRTPWGDIAWQLARATDRPDLFAAVAEQDEARVRPGKETIARSLPADRPVLILMDEVMNFMTAARAIRVGESSLASQFYEYVHNLTDLADSQDRLVVVAALPKSEEEMSADDWTDFRRLGKVLTRVAEPYVLAKDLEIPEIIRRRLFDDPGGRAQIDETARAYAAWLDRHRQLLPEWFPIDRAVERFAATYPFHPTVLSVFERKWRSLPSFQQTRGILRLLAQWVALAYADGFRGAHTDPLIGLGTAPLDEESFRTPVLDQLGSSELGAAIQSDIAGPEAFAERLDADAPESLRRARIHRKVATAIFFESSGGQIRERATLPEIRLAVGEPELEIGNVETALADLREACYYLTAEGNAYRFSTKANLNRRLADRRAALDPTEVEEHARTEVRRVIADRRGVATPIEVAFFPENPAAIPDLPALRLVVLGLDRPHGDAARDFIDAAMAGHGQGPRRFRNALIWVIPDAAGQVLEQARRHLACERLAAENPSLDSEDRQQLEELRARARADLTEAVWRTYHWLAFLDRDGAIREEDLGLLHSSAAASFQELVQARLRQFDEISDGLAPDRIVRNWPPSLTEWSTRAVRDAVYASSAFTRLLRPEALKETIARGVSEGRFGYATKRDAAYGRVWIDERLDPADVEFGDDVVLLPAEEARAVKSGGSGPEVVATQAASQGDSVGPALDEQPELFPVRRVGAVRWQGSIPYQKWTSFYTKVLQRLVDVGAPDGGLQIRVEFEARPPGGLYPDRADEARRGLRELGLPYEVALEDAEPEDRATDTG
jgi:hypothetical protein